MARFAQQLEQSGVASRATLQQAWDRGLRTSGPLSAALVQSGAPAAHVLEALCAASGIPRVPQPLPPPPQVSEDVRTSFADAGGMPVAQRPDRRLVVAFVEPEAVWRAAEARLPPHHAVLATAAQMATWAAGINTLPASRKADADPATLPRAIQQAPAAAAELQELSGLERLNALGHGGMAEVWLARTPTGQQVAVKQMAPALAQDAEALARFLREARTGTQLVHPGIVATLAVGRVGGSPALVSEYMDGGTLQQLLRRSGPLPSAVVAALVHPVLEALDHAHAQGVIHRDIKPANVMLSSNGGVKLMDFGIARSIQDATLTATQGLLGTPAYMSPEQVFARPLDGRSDLFSLGIIICELLTGTNPFYVEDNPGAMLSRIGEADVAPLVELCPEVDVRLAAVVGRLLRKDPNQRFSDAAAVAAAVAPLCPPAWSTETTAALVAQPAPLVELARATQSQRLMQLGQLAWEAGHQMTAAVALHQAALLRPDNAQVAQVHAQVWQQGGFAVVPEAGSHAAQALEAASSSSRAPGVLKRAADLCRAQGCVLQARNMLWRYLTLRGTDTLAHAQMAELTGAEPEAVASWFVMENTTGASVTMAMMAGIRTGGFSAVSDAGYAQGAQAMRTDDGNAPPSAAPEPEPVAPESFVRQVAALLRQHGGKLAVVVGVVLLSVWATKATRRFIDHSVTRVQEGLEDTADRFVDDPSALYGTAGAARSELKDAEQALQSGQVQRALDGFNRVLAAEGTNSKTGLRARMGRARAHGALGHADQARQDLQAIMAATPPEDPLHQAAAWLVTSDGGT